MYFCKALSQLAYLVAGGVLEAGVPEAFQRGSLHRVQPWKCHLSAELDLGLLVNHGGNCGQFLAVHRHMVSGQTATEDIPANFLSTLTITSV